MSPQHFNQINCVQTPILTSNLNFFFNLINNQIQQFFGGKSHDIMLLNIVDMALTFHVHYHENKVSHCAISEESKNHLFDIHCVGYCRFCVLHVHVFVHKHTCTLKLFDTSATKPCPLSFATKKRCT